MTPLRQPEPSTATNYNIDDLDSGDETDDDERPKKAVSVHTTTTDRACRFRRGRASAP